MGETITSTSQYSQNFRRLVGVILREVQEEKPGCDDWYVEHPNTNERPFGKEGRIFVGIGSEAMELALLTVDGQAVNAGMLGHVNFWKEANNGEHL